MAEAQQQQRQQRADLQCAAERTDTALRSNGEQRETLVRQKLLEAQKAFYLASSGPVPGATLRVQAVPGQPHSSAAAAQLLPAPSNALMNRLVPPPPSPPMLPIYAGLDLLVYCEGRGELGEACGGARMAVAHRPLQGECGLRPPPLAAGRLEVRPPARPPAALWVDIPSDGHRMALSEQL